jgi:hypothetical protein
MALQGSDLMTLATMEAGGSNGSVARRAQEMLEDAQKLLRQARDEAHQLPSLNSEDQQAARHIQELAAAAVSAAELVATLSTAGSK